METALCLVFKHFLFLLLIFQCSSTCHGGVKKRSLRCKRRSDEGMLVLAPDVLCYHAPKLQITMNCNAEVPCPSKMSKFIYGSKAILPTINESKENNLDEQKG